MLKTAILTLLNNGGQLNMDGDLACYPTHDGYYFVEYFFNEETVDALCLTAQEKNLLEEEEELVEIFDNPEEAVDFYLRLTKGKMHPLPACSCHDKTTIHNRKKTIHEKLKVAKIADKEDYF
jgi:hypothetical protein